MLTDIAYVWWCALTGGRGRLLRIAVTGLLGEGAVVVANHGQCPLGPLQERLGDPVPLFELVLSPRAAHRAVPVLGGIAGVPMVVLAWRWIWRRDQAIDTPEPVETLMTRDRPASSFERASHADLAVRAGAPG